MKVYSIKQVAGKIGISVDTIERLEKADAIIIKRGFFGRRFFTIEDCKEIEKVYNTHKKPLR